MDLYFNLYARSKQSALSILSAAVDLQHNGQHCTIKRPAVLKLQKLFVGDLMVIETYTLHKELLD